MVNIEIERKFLVKKLPVDIEKYPNKRFVQAYISTSPTIRLRNEGGEYILCVKSEGNTGRREFELELTKEQFGRLWEKVETEAVEKTRYFIPIDNGLTAELDVYSGKLKGLLTVEVEFETEAASSGFAPPCWFGEDVSDDYRYKNTSLALKGMP